MEKNEKIIWTNWDFNEDNWKESYEDYLECNNLTEEDCSLYDFIADEQDIWFNDERSNLNVDVEGVIIAVADFGLWNGRSRGGAIVGSNVSQILSSECDYCHWYCDRYNVRFKGAHHDGNNYYLYRVAKDRDEAQRILDAMVYDGKDEKWLMRHTKSLRPYVSKVYGW